MRRNYINRRRIAIINIITSKKKKDNQKKRNWGSVSDWVGVIINLIVGILTLLLFRQAVTQNEISTKNYDLAREAFDSTISAGQEAANQAERNYKLQAASINAQIENLKESQREFEKANDSYLQVTDFDTLRFRPDDIAVIKYQLENLGQPALVTNFIINASIDTPNKSLQRVLKDDKRNSHILLSQNIYLNKESSHKQNFGGNFIPPKVVITAVNNGDLNLYFVGKFFYKNLVTNTEKEYEFVVEYSPPIRSMRYLYAKNSTVDLQ